MNQEPVVRVEVRYWSWFKDLAGVDHETFDIVAGNDLGTLLRRVREKHPKLEEVRRSTLVAVGVEYQPENHLLGDGDEVSLFPPVQGG